MNFSQEDGENYILDVTRRFIECTVGWLVNFCETTHCYIYKEVFFINCNLRQKLSDCFQVRHPRCADRVPSISKLQSNRTFNISIAKRCFYIACLNNYTFRPLSRPSSGCTLSYYKANYTMYNVFFILSTRSRSHL